MQWHIPIGVPEAGGSADLAKESGLPKPYIWVFVHAAEFCLFLSSMVQVLEKTHSLPVLAGFIRLALDSLLSSAMHQREGQSLDPVMGSPWAGRSA